MVCEPIVVMIGSGEVMVHELTYVLQPIPSGLFVLMMTILCVCFVSVGLLLVWAFRRSL